MSEHEHKHEVKIFIDQRAHHSPNPTTGAALYALGNVKPLVEMATDEMKRAVVDVLVAGVDLGQGVHVAQADEAVRCSAGIAHSVDTPIVAVIVGVPKACVSGNLPV